MVLEKMDIISPEITLFYKTKRKHLNVPSGVLSLLGIIATVVIAIIYIVNFFKKKSPNIYFYTRHSNEATSMTISEDEFFHYVETFPPEIDDSIINIVGVGTLPNLYDPGRTLGYPCYSPVNEYFYEKCTLEDMKNHENLISDKNVFLKSYCLHKMFDYKKMKIINKTDPDFIFPKIDNVNISTYSIIVKKCTNDEKTTGYKRNCATEGGYNNLPQSINMYSARFHTVDRYIDIGNYKNPVMDYDSYYETGLMNSQNFPINYIHYQNVIINSKEGFLFEEKKISSFIYEKNEISSSSSVSLFDGVLCAGTYLKSSVISTYVREYKTLMDVLASIGGSFETVMMVCKCVNFFFNNYAIYNDSIDIFFETEQNQKTSNNLKNIKNV